MLLLVYISTILISLLYTHAASSLTLPLNTTSPSTPNPNTITCFEPDFGRLPTTLSTCRPTLNWIRTLPNYRRIQSFIENRTPKIHTQAGDHSPPFVWHLIASNCAIQIASGDPLVVDEFSFYRVRELAMEILDACAEGEGGMGYGGYAPLGRGVGWEVKVIGFVTPEGGDNGTDALDGLLEGVGLRNETLAADKVGDAAKYALVARSRR